MALNFISSLGIAGAQSGLQALTGSMAARTQYSRQKRLMNLQHHNQMALNKHGQEMAMKTWEETNYPAQIKMLKEAGLNPALLYGNGGAGGTTATGSGGTASGGTASRPEYGMMDILANAKSAKELELLDTQKKNIESQTNLNEANTGKSKAETLNIEVQTQLNKLYLDIGNATKEDVIDKATYEVEEIIKRNNLTDEQIELVKEQALTEGVKRQLSRSNIDLNNQQIDSLKNSILQGWEAIKQTYEKLSIDRTNTTLRGLEGKANLKSIEINMLKAIMENDVAWNKLNVEQQAIFVSMATSILNIR